MRKGVLKSLTAAFALTLACGAISLATTPANVEAEAVDTLGMATHGKAAIRLSSTNPGLRFYGVVSGVTDVSEIPTETEIGVKIEFTYNGNEYSSEQKIEKDKLYTKSGITGLTYNVVINDLTNAYNVDFEVTAYAKTGTTYEWAPTSTTRSIAQVAESAINAYTGAPYSSVYDMIVETAAQEFEITGNSTTVVGSTVQLGIAKTAMKNVTWASGNDEIATVDQNGLVTAKAVGDVEISATIAGVTKTVTINVTRETVKLGSAGYVEVIGDQAGTAGTYLVTDTISDAKVLAKIQGKAGSDVTIVSATQKVGDADAVALTYANNVFGGVQTGEKTVFTVTASNDKNYEIVLDVYTLVISNLTEYKAMAQILNANATAVTVNETETTTVGGYYVLEADISGAEASKHTVTDPGMQAIATEDVVGFTGIFDGRGHTIKGGVASGSAGILMAIVGKNGVIKNTTFEVYSTSGGSSRGLVAGAFSGTIQDCVIRTIKNGNNNYAGSINGVGLICNVMRHATVKNVVYDLQYTPNFGSNASLFGETSDKMGEISITNVFAIANGRTYTYNDTIDETTGEPVRTYTGGFTDGNGYEYTGTAWTETWGRDQGHQYIVGAMTNGYFYDSLADYLANTHVVRTKSVPTYGTFDAKSFMRTNFGAYWVIPANDVPYLVPMDTEIENDTNLDIDFDAIGGNN